MPFDFPQHAWSRRTPAFIALWMGLFGLVLTLAVSSGVAWLEYERRTREAQSGVEVESYLLADHAGRLFEGAKVALQTVAALSGALDWATIERSATLHRQLIELKSALPYVDDVWLNDDKGVLRASTFAFPAPPAEAADRENFKVARREGLSLFVGPSIIGRVTRAPTFLLSRRLEGPDGAFKGMISVTARLDYFAAYWQERGLPRNAYVGLYRESAPGTYDPLITYRNGGEQGGASTGPAGAGAVPAPGKKKSGRQGEVFDFIRPVGDLPLLLEVTFPSETVVTSWMSWALSYSPLVAIALAALAILTGLAWRQGRIDELSRAALVEANENLSVQIQSREQAEQQVRQMQKLEAIGQLTGGIAHDFNNFLTVIIGNAEVLLSGSFDRPRLFRAAQMVVSAAERGAELSHRLLAFARRQPLEPRIVDVNAVLAGLKTLLEQSIGESLDLKVRPTANIPPALVDTIQLETAVVNLAVNARDAMPKGGHVSIETRGVDLDHAAAAERGLAPGAYVVVSVADTGTGMTETSIARAFEPFYTTKPFGKGSGLGLSMVYGFARQSGGTVRIRSRPDFGTTVEIYLPAARGTADVVRRAKDNQPLHGNERILVVEDDKDVLALAAAVLEEVGYTITTATRGSEALERMESHLPFDLLFTDVVLPDGTDGAELARQARARQPDLKVLFTSGYNESETMAQDRLSGEIQLLNKPYRRLDLALKVREVLDAGRS